MSSNHTNGQTFQLFLEFDQKYQAGDFEEAARAISKLLALCPEWEHGNGWVSLSACYLECKDYQKALEACNKALQFPGMQETVASNLALALAGCGRLNESMQTLKLELESSCLPVTEENLILLIPGVSAYLWELKSFWQAVGLDIYDELAEAIPAGSKLWYSCRDATE